MSQQPAQQPSRSRNLPVYVPNTVTRQRYIIRTRAQAQRLGRQPLRDALTNSPTKMPSPNEPLFIHKGGYGSDTLGRKRALSPSMGNAMNISAKRLKPSVPAPAPSNHSAIPVSPIKVTGSARDAPESFVAKPPFTPPRDRTPTQALSTLPTGRPVDHASPRTVRPASIIDIFNTAPVPLQLPHAPPESLGPDPVHERRGGSDVVKSREVPLPAPNLFDISMRTESDQIVQADTSQLRRKYSTLSVDDTMVFDSPSKKATTSIRSTPMARKLSMIPRRVLEPDSVGQSKITSCLFSAAIPAKELASHSSSVVPSGSFPSTSTPSKVTNSLSPSKRSVSSATKHTLGEVPVRPSTSLGFSHPPGRTSLHNSTQASLSNLSMALEKLSIPRVRASLNGPGPVTPVTGGNIERSTARLPIDTKRRSKPPALSSHSLSGRLSGTTLGMRQPAGLNKHPRIGLGRPSGGNMGPPRRALSSMGPPPAPSAAVARATRTASASEATLLGSTPLLSSPPSIDTPDALRISPGEATLSREDKRNRRASIASRSLAEGGVVSSLNQPAEAAISAQNDDGSMDKKKLAILTILKNCVIYVDVRMEDGADAGELFVNMLKGLGARILTRLTPRITHIIFKDGSPTTLAKHKLYDNPKPFLVGVGWVLNCVENRKQADETQFLVCEPELVVLNGKRRKSMVPQPAAPASGPSLNFNLASTPLSSTQEESEESARSHTSSSPAPVARSNPLAPLERARQKTLAYAPKIPSPLKTAIRPADPNSGEPSPTQARGAPV